MSYGRWTKRGKGWCSVEIDSPHNGEHLKDLKERSPRGYAMQVHSLEKAGVEFDEWDDDIAALSFEARHTAKDRYIIAWCPGGGEHVTWLAADDLDACKRALDVLCPGRPDERDEVWERAQKLEKPDWRKRASRWSALQWERGKGL